MKGIFFYDFYEYCVVFFYLGLSFTFKSFLTGGRKMATQVNHSPSWQAPEAEEDWDEGLLCVF